MFVNLNGQLIKEEKATVSVNNRSFRFGDGFFETMRMCNGQIVLQAFHADRLFKTLNALQFEYPSFFTREFIFSQVLKLATKNEHMHQARVRITFFRGNGGLYDPENLNINWVIQTWPLENLPLQLHANGLVTGIYTGGFKAADAFANLKTTNFLLYSQAAMYAKQQHWNDALVLNHRGTIADATIANLFLVKGQQVVTPPLSDGPLAGVMRRHIIDQLPSFGYTIEEKTISPEMLGDFEAAFLSNAVYGIRWVKSIAEHHYQPDRVAGLHRDIIVPVFQNV